MMKLRDVGIDPLKAGRLSANPGGKTRDGAQKEERRGKGGRDMN